MANPNRSAQINKLHKVLKKHYKVASPAADRSVLDQLLYGCVLENASFEAADEALAGLHCEFFDLNEVRVSGTRELAEVMNMLPNAQQAGTYVKRTLQGVFEATYSFDLEGLKKQKLGQAVETLQKFGGAPPFAIAFVTQAALGGHAIPLDSGTLDALLVMGFISQAERNSGAVPGLERIIPKSKGAEFFSLIHQLGVEFAANPYSQNLHKLLLEIAPECKANLPKKGVRPAPADMPPPEPVKAKVKETEKEKDKESKKTAKKAGEEKPAEAAATKKKAPPAKPPAKKSAEKAAEKPTEKPATKKAPARAAAKSSTKSSSTSVTKRKPR